MLLACGTAVAFDRLCERAGLLPPNFRVPLEVSWVGRQRSAALRSSALAVIALALWIGVFAALGVSQVESAPPESLPIPQLFFLHAVFVAALILWYLLGFGGRGRSLVGAWREQLGFRTSSVAREIGIGVVAGIVGWLAVILALLGVALVFFWIGGEDAVPSRPPEVIGLVIALPVFVRVLLSLSAGVVEEVFFRGLLQPRMGIVVSSTLFVMAHMSYDQPFLLIGVGLLSLLFAYLVKWRQSVWAAISAHTVFDAIQLLIVIPAAMGFLDSSEPGPVAAALASIAWLR